MRVVAAVLLSLVGVRAFTEPFAPKGLGLSTKAERWNGRHAMFGWVCIIATGYCQKHGLFPEPDKLLEVGQWGTLAELTPRVSTISNERAVVLVGHVHALVVSLCAAFCPLPFQDRLLLAKDEPDEPPIGFLPPLNTGLTADAEMMNGRLAMLGISCVALYSIIYQVPFLTVVDQLIGGNLL
mmetsp:Transcript_17573/g.56999  ORF Transcript_17573/g.56999 Transcript_17573/m.56999 type:complete len:182 (-) Transcript_17573:420-965(-)